MTSKIVLIL